MEKLNKRKDLKNLLLLCYGKKFNLSVQKIKYLNSEESKNTTHVLSYLYIDIYIEIMSSILYNVKTTCFRIPFRITTT